MTTQIHTGKSMQVIVQWVASIFLNTLFRSFRRSCSCAELHLDQSRGVETVAVFALPHYLAIYTLG
jgi:hypothetical protein